MAELVARDATGDDAPTAETPRTDADPAMKSRTGAKVLNARMSHLACPGDAGRVLGSL
jgi:hypothetical protein